MKRYRAIAFLSFLEAMRVKKSNARGEAMRVETDA